MNTTLVNNDDGNKLIAINTIGSYISQSLNNNEYDKALNAYSECLQTILNTILIKSSNSSAVEIAITNLINNETNIHTIIVYTIQMLKNVNGLTTIDLHIGDDNSLIKNISEITNSAQVLRFIKLNHKLLYFNSNFKQFLTKVIEINISDVTSNSMNHTNISHWKDIYEEIISNFGNVINFYFINSIWYQELKLVYQLYRYIDRELSHFLYDENESEKQREYAYVTLSHEMDKLKTDIKLLKSNEEERKTQVKTLTEANEQLKQINQQQQNIQTEAQQKINEQERTRQTGENIYKEEMEKLRNSHKEQMEKLQQNIHIEQMRETRELQNINEELQDINKKHEELQNIHTKQKEIHKQQMRDAEQQNIKERQMRDTELQNIHEGQMREKDEKRQNIFKEQLWEQIRINENEKKEFDMEKHRLEDLIRTKISEIENLKIAFRVEKEQLSTAKFHESEEIRNQIQQSTHNSQQSINRMEAMYKNQIETLNREKQDIQVKYQSAVSEVSNNSANNWQILTSVANVYKQLKEFREEEEEEEETKIQRDENQDNVITKIDGEIKIIINKRKNEITRLMEVLKTVEDAQKTKSEEKRNGKYIIDKLKQGVENICRMYDECSYDNGNQLSEKMNLQTVIVTKIEEIRKILIKYFHKIKPEKEEEEEEKMGDDSEWIIEESIPIDYQLNNLCKDINTTVEDLLKKDRDIAVMKDELYKIRECLNDQEKERKEKPEFEINNLTTNIKDSILKLKLDSSNSKKTIEKIQNSLNKHQLDFKIDVDETIVDEMEVSQDINGQLSEVLDNFKVELSKRDNLLIHYARNIYELQEQFYIQENVIDKHIPTIENVHKIIFDAKKYVVDHLNEITAKENSLLNMISTVKQKMDRLSASKKIKTEDKKINDNETVTDEEL